MRGLQPVLLGNTTLSIFQRSIHSLTTAGGVDHRSTGGIPEGSHLWDVRHDFTFLGVAHGGGDAWIFRQRFLEGFQRHSTQRFILVHFFQTLIGQQVVFEELFRQLWRR